MITGQFSKNHFDDRNEFRPTAHGFDELYGNLYHLNAEEESEEYLYPKDPGFKAEFGPRGVLDCKATDTEGTEVEPGFGPNRMHECIDTGPLTQKRMETADQKFVDRTIDFIKRNDASDTPWFA